MVENNNVVLPLDEAKKLLIEKRESDHFVEETFRGLYYKDEENRLIDVLRTNIAAIRDQYKKAIAMTALIRACTKKRPRGIFTYTGDRYNDGRKDLQKSLESNFWKQWKVLIMQFLIMVVKINLNIAMQWK